MWFLLIVIHT
jgi:hypothetical protein